MHRIYLDWNATAPLRPEARAALLRHLDGPPGNASSVHAYGHRARMDLETARAAVANLLGARRGEIVFTSGGTESNNLAIYGAAAAARETARRIVTSGFEHPSVARVVDDLETRGFEVVRVLPDRHGRVPTEAILEAAVPERTALVSLMMANNEVGTLQPIAELGPALRARGILFHCDAAQAAGRVPVRFSEIGTDLLTCAAHKLGGPVGVGALVVREGLALAPLLKGGGQELNRRPGTESVGLIAAFGAAAAAVSANLSSEAARMAVLRDRLEAGLAQHRLEARVNGAQAPRLPNTSNLFFPGVVSESLVCALDLDGIAVSAGSACSSGAQRRSPVLLSMGLTEEAAGSIRVSLGPTTTEAEIDALLKTLSTVAVRARVPAQALGHLSVTA